ncbi:MAG: DJ-1/PfpI family protein [Clostridia bacterium]|nr:DJ-1/PfpI family protein [Clostridia bacterium]
MVYIFLANGFEEVEALAPLDILRRAEIDVKTVAVGAKKIVGSHGIEIVTDIHESEVTTDDMECVILPGGMPGTLNLEKSPIVTQSIRYCSENNLPICAICAAPSILGHMNLLKGKKAICFPGFEKELYDAVLSEDHVCVDGNIITAKGAGVALEFGLEITAMLKNREESDKIRKAIQMK